MYKEWLEILFPTPAPVRIDWGEPTAFKEFDLLPPEPIHKPYRMYGGLWGITGLRSDVETSHETYGAAKRSADALNARLAGGGPRKRRKRWY